MLIFIILLLYLLLIVENIVKEKKNYKEDINIFKLLLSFFFPLISISGRIRKGLYIFVSIIMILGAMIYEYSVLIVRYNVFININIVVGMISALIISALAIKFIINVIKVCYDYILVCNNRVLFCFMTPLVILLFGQLGEISYDYYQGIIVLLTIIFSLIFVYTGLINIILEDESIYGMNSKSGDKKKLKFKGIFTWFIILIANLYALLVYMNAYYPNFYIAKINNIDTWVKLNLFDLFYYLIITFTTVGFGDITLPSVMGKIVTILISLSGMIFSVVFVGVTLSKE